MIRICIPLGRGLAKLIFIGETFVAFYHPIFGNYDGITDSMPWDATDFDNVWTGDKKK